MLRDLDGSRPITFASNRHKRDLCLDLVDIVSWNRYDAWYGEDIAQIKPALDDMLKWLHSSKSGAKGKPVIMSEFGAGAIYGTRQRQESRWSEEYQSAVLRESLDIYLQHAQVSGAFIWQFSDCRITNKMWGARPRTMNNKGIVDEYRRPKLAYNVVKECMHAAAAKRDVP
jgi:beta-glucuronidase